MRGASDKVVKLKNKTINQNGSNKQKYNIFKEVIIRNTFI
jgi:hypothetical protein